MKTSTSLVASLAVLLSFCASQTAASECKTVKKGVLVTQPYIASNGTFVAYRPYAWNYLGYLSFYHTTNHPLINVEWQTCTPNLYQPEFDSDIPGRFYFPDTKQCLGVTDPNAESGENPTPMYTLKAVGCVASADGQEATKASIPTNFLAFEGRNATAWSGSTVSTNPGTNQGECMDGLWWPAALTAGNELYTGGEPNTTEANGAYAVHLICDYTSTGAIALNAFVVKEDRDGS